MIAGQALSGGVPVGDSDYASRVFIQSAIPGDIQYWDLASFWRQQCQSDTWTTLSDNHANIAPCNGS